jgi:hypothetical protein
MAVGPYGADWYKVVRMVRDHVETNDMRVVVSPRATARGSVMLAANVEFNQVLHACLLSQFTGTVLEELHASSHALWLELRKRSDSSERLVESGWQELVRNMSVDTAYEFCFGTPPKPVEEDTLLKAAVVVKSADDWARLQFLTLMTRDDINWSHERWQLRAAVYHEIKNSRWDFRDALFANEQNTDSPFVPAGHNNDGGTATSD